MKNIKCFENFLNERSAYTSYAEYEFTNEIQNQISYLCQNNEDMKIKLIDYVKNRSNELSKTEINELIMMLGDDFYSVDEFIASVFDKNTKYKELTFDFLKAYAKYLCDELGYYEFYDESSYVAHGENSFVIYEEENDNEMNFVDHKNGLYVYVIIDGEDHEFTIPYPLSFNDIYT